MEVIKYEPPQLSSSLSSKYCQAFFSLSLLFLSNKPVLPIFFHLSFHFLLSCCKSYNSGCHHLSSSNYHCLQSCPPTCQSNLHSRAKVIFCSNHVTPLFPILHCLQLKSKILNIVSKVLPNPSHNPAFHHSLCCGHGHCFLNIPRNSVSLCFAT